MRNSILAGILILCLTLTVCGSAFAAPVTPDVGFDAEAGLLTVSGEAEDDALITLMILKKGVVFNDTTKEVNANDVLYFDTLAASDGGFSFEVAFQGASGVYAASIADSKSGERYAFNVTMVNPDSYPTAVSALNTAAAGDFSTVFKPAFEANKADLGFDYTLDDTDEAIELFKAYIAENNLKTAEYEKNLKLYQTFCIIAALNEKDISDISGHLDSLYFESEALKDDFESVAEVSGASAAATAKMSGEDIKDLDDFYGKFIDGMVLGATEYTPGVNKLMSLLSEYDTEIGITKSITFNATASINGKSYDTIEDLAKAYNSYKSSASSNSGSGGGGGAGGRTSASGGSAGVPSAGVPSSQATSAADNVITASYHDIEGYKWATTAIIALTDLGIVNGKGDGMFAPEDSVLREEFAKIIVGALGEGTSDDNIFYDVVSDSWYCGWVNRAAELGICQGIGGGAFGVGSNITREDMCVMIVNALKSKGYEGTAAELTFADADDISDYAKEAVGILYNMGAVNGVSETEFASKESANRAQAAKIVYNVLKFL